jgi:hypothetical protein
VEVDEEDKDRLGRWRMDDESKDRLGRWRWMTRVKID